MRSWLVFFVVAAARIAIADATTPAGFQSVAFTTPGTTSWTVPANIPFGQAQISLWGGGGACGQSTDDDVILGGAGAYVIANVTGLSGGQVVTMYVGGGGTCCGSSGSGGQGRGSGGIGGTGNGENSASGGSGGGASAVFSVNTLYVVAGGGGGGGSTAATGPNGGAGGCTAGLQGQPPSSNGGGFGANGCTGGAAGTGGTGSAGSACTSGGGGGAGGGATTSGFSAGFGGGGGGGGYAGGGGGVGSHSLGYGGGGGGGDSTLSSFVGLCIPAATNSPVGTSDIYYVSSLSGAGGSGSNEAAGTQGQIVVQYDINECAFNNGGCINEGACVNTWGSFYCHCVSGTFGASCQTVINSCASNPCSPPGTSACVNSIGSFSCACNVGYSGKLCQTEIDECASTPCVQPGTLICVDHPGSFSCTCRPGYSGSLCQFEILECASFPCFVAGSTACVDSVNAFTCLCVPGYSGAQCQTDINECASNPCFGPGTLTCVDGINSFRCSCRPNHIGTLCQTYLGECAPAPEFPPDPTDSSFAVSRCLPHQAALLCGSLSNTPGCQVRLNGTSDMIAQMEMAQLYIDTVFGSANNESVAKCLQTAGYSVWGPLSQIYACCVNQTGNCLGNPYRTTQIGVPVDSCTMWAYTNILSIFTTPGDCMNAVHDTFSALVQQVTTAVSAGSFPSFPLPNGYTCGTGAGLTRFCTTTEAVLAGYSACQMTCSSASVSLSCNTSTGLTNYLQQTDLARRFACAPFQQDVVVPCGNRAQAMCGPFLPAAAAGQCRMHNCRWVAGSGWPASNPANPSQGVSDDVVCDVVPSSCQCQNVAFPSNGYPCGVTMQEVEVCTNASGLCGLHAIGCLAFCPPPGFVNPGPVPIVSSGLANRTFTQPGSFNFTLTNIPFNTVEIHAWGGAGGGTLTGGGGACVVANLTASSGSVLVVYVGQAGVQPATTINPPSLAGPLGGRGEALGGQGGNVSATRGGSGTVGGGGGGASGVRINGVRVLVVAGGGGGSKLMTSIGYGGVGGCLNGGNGTGNGGSPNGAFGAFGGAAAGSHATSGSDASDLRTPGFGGSGANSPPVTSTGGGGGGGGYAGGGGGDSSAGGGNSPCGGGGGSSFWPNSVNSLCQIGTVSSNVAACANDPFRIAGNDGLAQYIDPVSMSLVGPNPGAVAVVYDIDECALPGAGGCLNGGVCVNDWGTYHCACSAPWGGSLCQTNQNDCVDCRSCVAQPDPLHPETAPAHCFCDSHADPFPGSSLPCSGQYRNCTSAEWQTCGTYTVGCQAFYDPMSVLQCDCLTYSTAGSACTTPPSGASHGLLCSDTLSLSLCGDPDWTANCTWFCHPNSRQLPALMQLDSEGGAFFPDVPQTNPQLCVPLLQHGTCQCKPFANTYINAQGDLQCVNPLGGNPLPPPVTFTPPVYVVDCDSQIRAGTAARVCGNDVLTCSALAVPSPGFLNGQLELASNATATAMCACSHPLIGYQPSEFTYMRPCPTLMDLYMYCSPVETIQFCGDPTGNDVAYLQWLGQRSERNCLRTMSGLIQGSCPGNWTLRPCTPAETYSECFYPDDFECWMRCSVYGCVRQGLCARPTPCNSTDYAALCSAGAVGCTKYTQQTGDGSEVALVLGSCQCASGFTGEYCEVASFTWIPCDVSNITKLCGPTNQVDACMMNPAGTVGSCACLAGFGQGATPCANHITTCNNFQRLFYAGDFAASCTLSCNQQETICTLLSFVCLTNGMPQGSLPCGTDFYYSPLNVANGELASVCGPHAISGLAQNLTLANGTFVRVPVPSTCVCAVGWFLGENFPCEVPFITRACNDAEYANYCSPRIPCVRTCSQAAPDLPVLCTGYLDNSCFNQTFVGVPPNTTALASICGPFVDFTRNFTANCSLFTNAYGYSNCDPASVTCVCSASVLPAYQVAGQPPCAFNYLVLPCNTFADPSTYCGSTALSCTKRCTLDRFHNPQCYAANNCTCQPGYEQPLNPQSCGFLVPADICPLAGNFPGNVVCGPRGVSAGYSCPFPNPTVAQIATVCKPICQCYPGSGATPGSPYYCAGIDRPCTPEDVSTFCVGYAGCTKRCEYSPNNPSAAEYCVVDTASCIPSTTPVSFQCTPTQVSQYCGPATVSCTAQYIQGAFLSAQCTCTATGFAVALTGRQCEEWNLWDLSDTSTAPSSNPTSCWSECGPNLLLQPYPAVGSPGLRGAYQCGKRQMWSRAPWRTPSSSNAELFSDLVDQAMVIWNGTGWIPVMSNIRSYTDWQFPFTVRNCDCFGYYPAQDTETPDYGNGATTLTTFLSQRVYSTYAQVETPVWGDLRRIDSCRYLYTKALVVPKLQIEPCVYGAGSPSTDPFCVPPTSWFQRRIIAMSISAAYNNNNVVPPSAASLQDPDTGMFCSGRGLVTNSYVFAFQELQSQCNTSLGETVYLNPVQTKRASNAFSSTVSTPVNPDTGNLLLTSCGAFSGLRGFVPFPITTRSDFAPTQPASGILYTPAIVQGLTQYYCLGGQYFDAINGETCRTYTASAACTCQSATGRLSFADMNAQCAIGTQQTICPCPPGSCNPSTCPCTAGCRASPSSPNGYCSAPFSVPLGSFWNPQTCQCVAPSSAPRMSANFASALVAQCSAAGSGWVYDLNTFACMNTASPGQPFTCQCSNGWSGAICNTQSCCKLGYGPGQSGGYLNNVVGCQTNAAANAACAAPFAEGYTMASSSVTSVAVQPFVYWTQYNPHSTPDVGTCQGLINNPNQPSVCGNYTPVCTVENSGKIFTTAINPLCCDFGQPCQAASLQTAGQLACANGYMRWNPFLELALVGSFYGIQFSQGSAQCVCDTGWAPFSAQSSFGGATTETVCTNTILTCPGQCTGTCATTCAGNGVFVQDFILGSYCACNPGWSGVCCQSPVDCPSQLSKAGCNPAQSHVSACPINSEFVTFVCETTAVGQWIGPCCNVFNWTATPCAGTTGSPQLSPVATTFLTLPGPLVNSTDQFITAAQLAVLVQTNPSLNYYAPFIDPVHNVLIGPVSDLLTGEFTGWLVAALASRSTSQPECVCPNGGASTGQFCQFSSCPQGCNGRGTCVQGVCQSGPGGECGIDNQWAGCACQFNQRVGCSTSTTSSTFCSGAGTCVEAYLNTSAIGFDCSCPPSRLGNLCQVFACPNDCFSSQSHGTCNGQATPPVCQCTTQSTFGVFAGPDCGTDVTCACGTPNNNCSPPPSGVYTLCSGQGSCVANPVTGVYSCQCRNGYSGSNCEAQPCNPPCGPHGVCNTINPQAPFCQCYLHWAHPNGHSLCQIGDACCSVSTCGFGASALVNAFTDPPATCICANSSFAYPGCTTLACPVDPTNNITCGQVNPVATDAYTCNNGVCSCGYSGTINPATGTCVSLCSPNPLHTQQVGFQVVHGHKIFTGCICQPGFLLPNCTQPFCQNGGTFSTVSNACSCPPGTTGTQCQSPACSGHGIYFANNNTCACYTPYGGSLCQVSECLNGGYPDATLGGLTPPNARCHCTPAFSGILCESSLCGPYGVPQILNSTYSVCECDTIHTGFYCNMTDCQNGGVFNPNISTSACQCTLQFNPPVCDSRVCGPAGIAVQTPYVVFNATSGHNVTLYNTTCRCISPVVTVNSDGNCTLPLCGPYGSLSEDFQSCICSPVLTRTLNMVSPGHSILCEPVCMNNGTYDNSILGCNCPTSDTVFPFCLFEINGNSTSSTGLSSSSTGGLLSSSSTGPPGNSSTGTHRTSSSTGTNPANEPPPTQLTSTQTAIFVSSIGGGGVVVSIVLSVVLGVLVI